MRPVKVQKAYNQIARVFDFSTCLYPFFGFRFHAYRKIALTRLQIQPGDHVVDLGCGTGLNFPLIQERIGPRGRITGVDFSSGMLQRAQSRVNRAGWGNIELVHQDMSTYQILPDATVVFTSGALGFLEHPDEWIKKTVQQLPPNARFGILDLKNPEHWPKWLFHLFFTLFGYPFGVTPDYVACAPWKTAQAVSPNAQISQHYGGAVYITTVKKGRN